MSGYWRLDLVFLSFSSSLYVGSGTQCTGNQDFLTFTVRDGEKECDQRAWRTDSR